MSYFALTSIAMVMSTSVAAPLPTTHASVLSTVFGPYASHAASRAIRKTKAAMMCMAASLRRLWARAIGEGQNCG